MVLSRDGRSDTHCRIQEPHHNRPPTLTHLPARPSVDDRGWPWLRPGRWKIHKHAPSAILKIDRRIPFQTHSQRLLSCPNRRFPALDRTFISPSQAAPPSSDFPMCILEKTFRSLRVFSGCVKTAAAFRSSAKARMFCRMGEKPSSLGSHQRAQESSWKSSDILFRIVTGEMYLWPRTVSFLAQKEPLVASHKLENREKLTPCPQARPASS